MSQDSSVTGSPGYGPTGTAQPGNGLAIAGLVCGLVGLLFFSVVLGPLAIIFGGIGWSKANRGAKYKGLSIAAVVLGIVDLILFVVLIAAAAHNGGSVFFHVG
jgi:hypothetical protein